MVKEGAPDSFEVDFDEDDDGRSPVCESCCNTTACNNGGSCGVADYDYHNGRMCFNCEELSNPNDCDKVTWCDQDSQCYTSEITSGTGTANSHKIYHSACTGETRMCGYSDENFKYSCCQTNLCNNQIRSQQSQFVPIPTTKTTTTTKSTTTTTTTTTTPPPTTTTPTTTTTTPTTTQSQGPPSITSVTITPAHYHYGDDVQLICDVKSNPRYNSLGWNMMATQNHIPSNVHAESSLYKAVLSIKNLSRDNLRQYQCYVQNSFGHDSQIITLTAPK